MEYDKIADQYAASRKAQNYIGNGLMSELSPDIPLHVLEFGCGTGNYIKFLSLLSNWKLHGIDASDHMLHFAQKQNTAIPIKKGTESDIPFDNNYFDYIYMVDVIHHIQNLNTMFREFSRISKEKALLCICTESETQRKEKFWYRYFPSAFGIDNRRFYAPEQIIQAATENNYTFKYIEESNIIQYHSISSEFVSEIENKSISVLHLIDQQEYDTGLENILYDYQKLKMFWHKKGHCFIWLQKI